MGMRFGTWNVRSPYRAGLFTTVKTDLREMGWDCMDWIHLAQDRYQWQALVNTVTELWVP
jgi:hypothetical protein